MAYTYYNPNPVGRFVEDCCVRAITKALDIDWDSAHVLLDMNSIKMGTMPHDNDVIASVLRQNGFYKDIIPNSCPDCYTAEDFTIDHPTGKFVLGFGTHVTAVEDGVIYDAWDSSRETPIYYWYKKEDEKNGHAANATNATRK